MILFPWLVLMIFYCKFAANAKSLTYIFHTNIHCPRNKVPKYICGGKYSYVIFDVLQHSNAS